jgi:DNA-binding beta-propeller fold protein YncE
VVGAIGTAGALDLAVGPDGRTAYVVSATGIDVVDLTTNLTVRTIVPAGAKVDSVLAVTADGRRLVSTDGGRRASAVDVATGSAVTLVDGDSVRELAATPDASLIYLPGEGIGEQGPVRVVDTATGAAQDIPGTEDTYDIVVSPDGRSVYCFGLRGTRVIDTATGAVREGVGQNVVSGPAVVAHDGAHLFEVDILNDTLEVRTLEGLPVARAPLGGHGRDAALSPDGTRLYVAIDQSLLVVDVRAFA